MTPFDHQPAAALPQNKSAVYAGSHVSRRTSTLVWILMLAPIGYLWFRLINNLRLEWSTNPQYSYGWMVPLLCVGLLVRRWQTFEAIDRQISPSNRLVSCLFAVLAFLYLPTRLIEGATPEWRPIQWALGTEAIGLTLCAIHLGRGRGWTRQFAFPICFFFVAIPWPTMIEAPIIQTLTQVNATIVIEFLNLIGIPAIQHGNLIEVGTGIVGIDEACSGIRSFQSSLMVSLFLGEYYRLPPSRRAFLIFAGYLFSMAFNICRTSFLTVIAAKQGVAAIARFHDPAGVSILVACTAGMWGLAFFLRGPNAPDKTRVRSDISGPDLAQQLTKFRPFALLMWLVIVETGVSLWYRSRESHLAPSPVWSLVLPQDNLTFKATPVTPDEQILLRYDEAAQGSWEADGIRWQGYYFNWFPGRVAGYLAKRHTPDICLPASGRALRSGPELLVVKVHGVELPVRCYVFAKDTDLVYVFHCRWEAGAIAEHYTVQESARFNLVRGIWAGRGNQGQKVIEFISFGSENLEQAKAALLVQLENLIRVETPKTSGRNPNIGG